MRPSLVETDRTARRDVPMSPMSGDTAGDRLMALILTETDADSDTIDAIVTELRNVEAEARGAERAEIARLHRAFLDIAREAGEDVGGITDPAQITYPPIEVYALNAVKSLHAAYDECLQDDGRALR